MSGDRSLFDKTVLIRGAGEIASGVAHRLWRSGFQKLVMTEIQNPIAVRRKVSFCEAVFDEEATVEKIEAALAKNIEDVFLIWNRYKIAVMVDPWLECLSGLKPDILVDAILAKRNLGTKMDHAGLVIGLGPGFEAGKDCHCIVETNRGHDLGRLIFSGYSSDNTGVPGSIMGQTLARVIRSPVEGVFESYFEIGALVESGTAVGKIADTLIESNLRGILRGIIRNGSYVGKYTKIGDIDPRSERRYCYTISDKARAVGGSVLEAILAHHNFKSLCLPDI
ncbi:MAG: selenium-dependent molybdenum cofactor biosynthesis protein YqeB [Syntrophaceae bacterium]|nr:selenium-dependent molybdenum cofactor biosynthesis protein YqeB [Syntrophaceae bacterium]